MGYVNPDLDRTGVSVPKLHAMKQANEKIAMMTAYDFSFGQIMDAAGVDIVLVGDSLGMVIQGQSSTLPVTASCAMFSVLITEPWSVFTTFSSRPNRSICFTSTALLKRVLSYEY